MAELQLRTLFVLDAAGRIRSTREPQATAGPRFMLIRGKTGNRWAVRSDVTSETAKELDQLASEEPPYSTLHATPVHADRYLSLLAGQIHSGPAFTFPQAIDQPPEVVIVEDEQLLEHHFSGWTPGEIRAGRAPVMAVMAHGYPVSICYCARRSEAAAEAGVETAAGFRGRGFGPRVTAAWALAISASGRIPLYSTDWSNEASLAVARKLGLTMFAEDWSISDYVQI